MTQLDFIVGEANHDTYIDSGILTMLHVLVVSIV